MKVSDASLYYRFLSGLDDGRRRLSRAVDQISDGKRVRTAFDDPAGAHTALALRGRLVQIQGYDRTAQSARSDLTTMDAALNEVGNLLNSARTEAMAGASGIAGTTNQARADKIDSLRQELLGLANTAQNGRYLFAGTATGTTPFEVDGTYHGDDAEVAVPVDAQETVPGTLSGNSAFKQGEDIFQVLSDLSTALRTNQQTDVSTTITRLRTAIDDVAQVRGNVGSRINRIDDLVNRHGDETTRLKTRIGEIEDVNMDQAVVDLQAAQTSREALSASAVRVLGRSLFDYLG